MADVREGEGVGAPSAGLVDVQVDWERFLGGHGGMCRGEEGGSGNGGSRSEEGKEGRERGSCCEVRGGRMSLMLCHIEHATTG